MSISLYMNFLQQLLFDFSLLLIVACVVAEIVFCINLNKTKIFNMFKDWKGHVSLLAMAVIVMYGGAKPVTDTAKKITIANMNETHVESLHSCMNLSSGDVSNKTMVVDRLLKHGGHTYGFTIDLADTTLSNSVLEKVKIFANGSLAFYGWNEKIYINQE